MRIEKSTVVLILVTVVIIAAAIFPAIWGAEYLKTKFKGESNSYALEVLPGPKNQLSKMSEFELNARLKNAHHVLGAWVVKLNYTQREYPVIWSLANVKIIDTALENFAEIQASGRGFSSANRDKDAAQSLRNSSRAKSGQVVCGKIEQTNIPKWEPKIKSIAKSVCRASLPPFDKDINLAIVVVTDIDMNDLTSPDVVRIRRELLELQLNIYNRDYLNTEIWAGRPPSN